MNSKISHTSPGFLFLTSIYSQIQSYAVKSKAFPQSPESSLQTSREKMCILWERPGQEHAKNPQEGRVVLSSWSFASRMAPTPKQLRGASAPPAASISKQKPHCHLDGTRCQPRRRLIDTSCHATLMSLARGGMGNCIEKHGKTFA